MDKRPIDIIEDDFNRVVGFELKGSFVSGKRELISCFQRFTSCYLVNFTM